MSLRTCDRCGGPMDVFDDGPCCGHTPACAISFCWPCARIWMRGACAVDLARHTDGWARDPSRDPRARLERLRQHRRAAR